MIYEIPLIEGQFLKRYKRFFADVEVQGETVVAHVPNTGSLKGICDAPRKCRIQPSNNPVRKLKFTLEQVLAENSWVGVNTHRANEIVWGAFENKTLPHWQNFISGQREVKLNKESRLDFKFAREDGSSHYVEVKSVTMAESHTDRIKDLESASHIGSFAMFPDAVTTRGLKHLHELEILLSENCTSEILFVVQRTDCTGFAPAIHIDPEYAKALAHVQKKGVQVNAFVAEMTDQSLILTAQSLPVVL